MSRSRITLISAFLIISLALLGIGYGLWFEELSIHGTVVTGELDVEFSGPYPAAYPLEGDEWITGGSPADLLAVDSDGITFYETGSTVQPTDEQAALFELKDVVDCYAFLEGNGELNDVPGDEAGFDRLRFEITGAYPGYHCKFGFDVHNTGTVPVHVLWEGADANPVELIESFKCWDTASPHTVFDMRRYQGIVPVQLHDNILFCEIQFHFGNATEINDRPAQESTTYRFAYGVRTYQWNEDGLSGGGD